jgi:hypothetical protein
MTAAGSLPVEKRSTFLERVAGRMQLRGAHLPMRISTTRCAGH